jgi:hypothetical protein
MEAVCLSETFVNHLQDHKASQLRRLLSTSSAPWESQISHFQGKFPRSKLNWIVIELSVANLKTNANLFKAVLYLLSSANPIWRPHEKFYFSLHLHTLHFEVIMKDHLN